MVPTGSVSNGHISPIILPSISSVDSSIRIETSVICTVIRPTWPSSLHGIIYRENINTILSPGGYRSHGQ
jgi:hypothetical protein